uniref:Uncharacterized protein n=1 Tax=Rhizophora mucronata TaxID=61149 RepID=A0A2P2INF8_RHIMU
MLATLSCGLFSLLIASFIYLPLLFCYNHCCLQLAASFVVLALRIRLATLAVAALCLLLEALWANSVFFVNCLSLLLSGVF